MILSGSISPLYTDYYQLTMSQAYFRSGLHQDRACFDYFFRKLPFSGGYVVFTGLQELLELFENLRFSDNDLGFLKKLGFERDFLDYLEDFRFKADIYGMKEGEVVFPFEPILRIEGNLIEGQLAETLLLNTLNFQSLVATKASRIRRSAGDRLLSDFGLRRAQGLGGLSASRASVVGGFDNTSNVYAASCYQIPVSGTMAHSFIESFSSELDAFRHYAATYPDRCTLLIDTYNTLKSGLPNAIIVARELEQKKHKLAAIRLDSGDLAYLSRQSRKILDDHGLHYVKIVVSNQLDEHVIKSLLEQKAPIDYFGVGTSLVTGRPDAAIDGVYKLSWSSGSPRLKISENTQKITLPGIKKVLRFQDDEGRFYADCICLEHESEPGLMLHPFVKEKRLELKGKIFEPLFVAHMKNGQRTQQPEPLELIRERAATRLNQLPDEHKRFDFPHIYKVGISQQLAALRQELIDKYQQFI